MLHRTSLLRVRSIGRWRRTVGRRRICPRDRIAITWRREVLGPIAPTFPPIAIPSEALTESVESQGQDEGGAGQTTDQETGEPSMPPGDYRFRGAIR